MIRRAMVGLAFLPLIAACSDSTGPAAGTPIELRFGVVSNATTSAAPAGVSYSRISAAPLELPAEGGTYVIDDVQLIVSGFELAGADACSAAMADSAQVDEEHEYEGEGEDCEFEAAPMLLALPLDGGMLSVATDPFPDGTYSSVKFEVENLDPSDDAEAQDSTAQQAVAEILAQVRTTYPDFPANASMVVHGQFVPTTGDAQDFTVFFDAEIEIRLPIDPPLVIPGDAALTVEVDPTAWFTGLDFLSLNGRTVEFEAEMEHGFHGTEVEHDD